LKKNHGNDWKIWNLSGRKYDHPLFRQHVSGISVNLGAHSSQVIDEFWFFDHHNPPLELLFHIINSMDEFLDDPQKVAVIHCIGGKGELLHVGPREPNSS
jgi:protein-tyrosine phosphatase